MSDLSFIERSRLEELLEMRSGYVLDFSNRTFEEFVVDSTGKAIYDRKYDYESGSKANRLRRFWKVEPNHLAGKLIADLLEYIGGPANGSEEVSLYEECERISQRLQQSTPVPELDAIEPTSIDRGFEILAREVRGAIERNEPEAGLDRLHTLVVKYVRFLCSEKGIDIAKTKPLHSLFGGYVKVLRSEGLIESEMSERILKSSISILESFNRVRNEKSLAHDNPVVSYDESLLIFNHITGLMRFLSSVRAHGEEQETRPRAYVPSDDDIPF